MHVFHDRTNPERVVFTYLTGQFDNLGDTILRRALVGSLDGIGTWHVYVGRAPLDYVQSLQLPDDSVTYSSRLRWIWAAGRALAVPGRAALVANPGEISSTPVEFALGIVTSLLAVAARAGRNPIFRLGIGARDRRRPFIIGHEIAARLSTVNVWRDEKSRESFKIGHVAPDWAFALRPDAHSLKRSLLILSYRDDKPIPLPQSLRAVVNWARIHDLEVAAIAQVKRDETVNRAIASQLGIRYLTPESDSLDDIEHLARETYARASVVLSNRIHVLILAAVEGATPGAVLGHEDVKVGRTLAAGHLRTPVYVDGTTDEDVETYLDRAVAEGTPNAKALARARQDLREVAMLVKSAINDGGFLDV